MHLLDDFYKQKKNHLNSTCAAVNNGKEIMIIEAKDMNDENINNRMLRSIVAPVRAYVFKLAFRGYVLCWGLTTITSR